ncbi:callose synthase 12-like [Rhodamnia argentea]|uniref:1,3-beta-glucan synthase n=1 Tax=Rhodamnia argentea TaxID=178133 RepID=A0ABM3GTA9_9MYRT|nr:callose synthase 12-like [Rhodamnia argentea]
MDQVEAELEEEVYNIVPLRNRSSDHPCLRSPELRNLVSTLRTATVSLRKPPFAPWSNHYDLLDWLSLFFGFQEDNARNQREHLVLHLANRHLRSRETPRDDVTLLDPAALLCFRKKLLRNYEDWCCFLGKKSEVWLIDGLGESATIRRELLYVSLYLLIWGECANLRFLPECICYIFHHMARELNMVLEDYIDSNTGQPFLPETLGEKGFLNGVVKPLYEVVRMEVQIGRNGSAPHSEWRNYDDINEYFWSRRCFEELKWPLDESSRSFKKFKMAGKTGFVERRSFWTLFRSFNRLWLMLVLFLQAAIIIAWEEEHKFPWQALQNKEIQVRVLSAFVTWSGLHLLESLLDSVMQWGLVSRQTWWIGMRMVVRNVIAAMWAAALGWFYVRIWLQRNEDREWSAEADKRLDFFLDLALVFVLLKLSAVALSYVPSFDNFLVRMNWRMCELLMSRTFVGRHLREGMKEYAKYAMFWVSILATKFFFSYFLQIQPMISPTKQLLQLRNVDYRLHQFFYDRNGLAIGLMWFPMVLIYMMDLQIWYSIWTFLVGVAVGLFSRLGAIQNNQHLRLWFDHFVREVAKKFNLVGQEQLLYESESMTSNKFSYIKLVNPSNWVSPRLKKLECNQLLVRKFAVMWNEIIRAFREEDIISDQVVELLELPKISWTSRVISWPYFLLSNELLFALNAVCRLADAPDARLWHKICKNEYRRCAVIEAYDSVKHLLLEILRDNIEEHSIVAALFDEIDRSLQTGRFSTTFDMTVLPKIHASLIHLVELLNGSIVDPDQVASSLQALYNIVVLEFFKQRRTYQQLKEDGLAPQNSFHHSGLHFEIAIRLLNSRDGIFSRQIRRLRMILTTRDSLQNIPASEEARRRIAFFCNSLFMDLPRAPPVERIKAFSVLTPYYNEEVLYSKEELQKENEDGISTLYYLQTIYSEDWQNFMERMHQEGMVSPDEIWTTKLRDLRLWASYRGQTLARTVRGMMNYSKALKLLAFLEYHPDIYFSQGLQEPGSTMLDDNKDCVGMSSLLSEGCACEHGVALMKYTYVVACQEYGYQKAKSDPKAEEISYLMENNEALRITYVDEVSKSRGEKEYFSVLVKYDRQSQKEVEIYRIKLPGPFNLGEGKPENQNQAIIFTRGEAIQTIDMNQDNYLEEALKMPNLLEEFERVYGTRNPTILGLREHIFTGSISSLAWFMSAQETSFVTSGQRVLADPLKVRMHYGHPDVFDRIWFLTRGGLSKASRRINISEDIFAGFNCTLRGGNVTHHEYIQIGKGRDVGLNQISMFEAKIASGSGEQALSRDVYRLGSKLDFFRMLSLFHSTVGFYFNNIMVIWTIYALLWGRLYMALSGLEGTALADKANKNFFGPVVNIQLIQLILLTGLPAVLDGSIEQGILSALWDFLILQLELSPVFYTFSMGTRSHFFGRTLLHGGAKYQGTGRGFALQHRSFTENYRFYARSHFVKALEIALVLTVYTIYSPLVNGTFLFIDTSITGWLLVASWILSPFIFNPYGLDWLKTVNDFDEFMSWIRTHGWRGGLIGKSTQSWKTWWYEEQDHLRTTGFWGKFLEVILNLRFFFFQYGIVYHLHISSGSTSLLVYLLSWAYIAGAFGMFVVILFAREKFATRDHSNYRLVLWVATALVALALCALVQFTNFKLIDFFPSLLAFIPTGWGIISIAQVFRSSIERTRLWDIVVYLARLYDLLFGAIVMVPVAVLAWLPGFQSMQTRILYNEAFVRGVL